MSLGVEHSTILNAVKQNSVSLKDCQSIYLAETYGILGFDEDANANVELMEKGRGSEYGFCGGSGGQGCLMIGYNDGAVAGHTADFPGDVSSLMVIADQSKSWAAVQAKAPLHYGGITKSCWKVNLGDDERLDLKEVPYFWIGEKSGSAITGVKTFTGEAGEAAKDLLQQMPKGWIVSGDVGLFPCFTRGVNQYGAENVETEAISKVLPKPPRAYGMFAHGELGPASFSGFVQDDNGDVEHDQHSMSTILSIHSMPM